MRGLFKLFLVIGLIYLIVKYLFQLVSLFTTQKKSASSNIDFEHDAKSNPASNKKRIDNSEGEYIDYEEVK